MVYDVSVPASFQFIKMLHDQMFESRDMTNVPIIVIANKMDIVANVTYNQSSLSSQYQQHPSLLSSLAAQQIFPASTSGGGHRKSQRTNGRHFLSYDSCTGSAAAGGGGGGGVGTSALGGEGGTVVDAANGGGGTMCATSSGPPLTSDVINHHHHHPHQHSSNFSRVNSCVGALMSGGGGGGGSAGPMANGHALVQWNQKEILAVVKKSWRCSYVECSALYNWNIVTVFRELAVTLDMIANGQVIGSQSSSQTKKKRCLMF